MLFHLLKHDFIPWKREKRFMSHLEGILHYKQQQESDGWHGLGADYLQQSMQAAGDVGASIVSILQMERKWDKDGKCLP